MDEPLKHYIKWKKPDAKYYCTKSINTKCPENAIYRDRKHINTYLGPGEKVLGENKGGVPFQDDEIFKIWI